jgi:hypothetical protein
MSSACATGGAEVDIPQRRRVLLVRLAADQVREERLLRRATQCRRSVV